MAKQTQKAEPKKYFVNEHILREGYYALIDGTWFVVDAKTTSFGMRAGKQVELVDRPSRCWQAPKDAYNPSTQGVDEEIKIAVDHNEGLTEIGENFFIDLTKEQVHQLSTATVIPFPED